MPLHMTPLQIYSTYVYYAILLGFIAIYYTVFRRTGDVAFKRKWWPWFMALFVVFTLAKLAFFFFRMSSLPNDGGQKTQLMVMIAVIAGLVFIRLKNTKFCDKCSAMLRGRIRGARKSCPKCGTQVAS